MRLHCLCILNCRSGDRLQLDRRDQEFDARFCFDFCTLLRCFNHTRYHPSHSQRERIQSDPGGK